MLITKKGRDGVELTEKTLNIQAKILFDVTQGGPDNALYGDLYKWMDSKEISTGEKEVQHRSKKTGKLASGKDYEDRKNSGEKFVDTIVDKKQNLTEYFGMAIDEKGQQVAGLGIRGRVLTDKGNRQKEKLNQELANPVLKNADGTKVATGYTMTKKERETALGMVDATDDEATKKVKEENKRKIEAIAEKFGAGKTGEEKDEIKEMAGLTVLLGEYKKQEKINGKSREISAKEALGISSRMLELSKNNSGAKRIMDVMVVGEDTPVKPIGDVDVFTPAGKDTDDLGNPRGPESPTEDTVDVKTEELEELKLNLGYSVEGFARKAAKGVIIQNDMLGNNEREKVTRLAVDTLRSETHDELALSETYDAELDDLINGYRDLDDDGFIDETNLTQEEIMQKRHEDRVKNVQRWYADGTLRESRSVMARATGEALGATASATYGNVAKVSAGIIGGSVITGLQREGNLQNAFLSSAGAMSAEDSVEKIVMGTYASENKYDKKDKKKEKKLPTIGTKAGDLTEKAFKVHRAASEDINNPKYESRGTAVESSSQERTMTRLLSNMEELKRGKKK